MGVKLQSSSGGSVEIAAPVTASNYTLTAPTTSSTIDTLARTGNVLQVVQSVYTDRLTTTSTSFVTFLSASITPSSSTSKILVRVHSMTGQNSGALVFLGIFRNSTSIIVSTGGGETQSKNAAISYASEYATTPERNVGYPSIEKLDAPNTASPITYDLKVCCNGGTAAINTWMLNTGCTGVTTLTLMEIAG